MARCDSPTTTIGSRTNWHHQSRSRCPSSRRVSVRDFASRSSRGCCRRALNEMPLRLDLGYHPPTPFAFWLDWGRSWRVRSPCCLTKKRRPSPWHKLRLSDSRTTSSFCCWRRSGSDRFSLVPPVRRGELRVTLGKACACPSPVPNRSCQLCWSMTASRSLHPVSPRHTFSSRRSPDLTTPPGMRPSQCVSPRVWDWRSRRCVRVWWLARRTCWWNATTDCLRPTDRWRGSIRRTSARRSGLCPSGSTLRTAVPGFHSVSNSCGALACVPQRLYSGCLMPPLFRFFWAMRTLTARTTVSSERRVAGLPWPRSTTCCRPYPTRATRQDSP